MKLSVKSNQRGFSPVMIVVAVVVLAVIGLAGWKMTQKDSVIKNATPAQKTAISECQKTFKDKDLCNFSVNTNFEKQSYKMVMTITGANASSLTILSDGKSNTQINGTSAGQAFDTVSLNGDTYLKGTDGTWIKYPKSDSSAPKNDSFTSDIKVDNTFTAAAAAQYSYKKLGKEACGKLTCLKYQFIDKTQPTVTTFVWFDTKDYRMQRYSTKDANGTTDMTITYQAVTIKAPTPVKDFSVSNGIDAQALQQAAAAAAASSDTGDGQ